MSLKVTENVDSDLFCSISRGSGPFHELHVSTAE